MNDIASRSIRLFQFPRMFAVPNLSPFCAKMETWLRIAGIPYQVVDTPDPRKGPRGKLPFIEDGGARVADSSVIIDHLVRTRGIDLDAGLNESQRALALLVQRTVEEHYSFILAYTHLVHEEGFRHTGGRFDAFPALIRPLIARLVRKRIASLLWQQGILRHSHDHIMAAAIADWRAILAVMSDGPFFFGEKPTTVDASVFGALAPTVLTPIETPIRDFLRAQPRCMRYVEAMRTRFFPELAGQSTEKAAA